MDKPFVYVLIRKDLSDEQKAVQIGHAALEAGFRFPKPELTASLIVLQVEDRAALMAAAERLDRYGIEYHLFFEPDFGMGHSALATRPVFGSERHLFRKWNLYRREECIMA